MKAERPLECTGCKQPIAVFYTEVIGDTITRRAMCASCPALQYGLGSQNNGGNDSSSPTQSSLYCSACNTSLEEIRMGHALGCDKCYELFSECIIADLEIRKKIPPMAGRAKKTPLGHVGRSAGESAGERPSLSLAALKEALAEALHREDYEQAAWIRDQMNAATIKESEAPSKTNKKRSKRKP